MQSQATSEPHICHLTVLNPARHSRIFYKEARSQLAGGYQVTVIGQDAAEAPYVVEGIRIVPTGVFSRMSWARWRAPRRIAGMAIATQADIFQIHAPELLPVVRKIQAALPTAKFIYDMHEDYQLNILYAGYYPRWLRGWLSRRVRRVELAYAQQGHAVVYAEECYEGILPVAEDKVVVVRNKFLAPAEVIPAPEFSNTSLPLLLYSGTIAENWGVMDTLLLWKELQAVWPSRLCIAGHTHDAELLAQIAEFIDTSPHPDRVFVAGGADYLPYEQMLGWIQAADVGLALYAPRINIRDRIPTKFYEFMAAGKPVLFSRNPAWDALNAQLRFGWAVATPLKEATIAEVGERLRGLAEGGFTPNYSEADFGWDSEAKALLALLERLKSA